MAVTRSPSSWPRRFVTFLHNRCAWVTPLSRDNLDDLYTLCIEVLYTLCIEVECETLRRAAPFSAAENRRLERLLTLVDKASRSVSSLHPAAQLLDA